MCHGVLWILKDWQSDCHPLQTEQISGSLSLKSTDGATLAMGDIKAMLMQVARKHTHTEISKRLNLGAMMKNNNYDSWQFGPYCNQIWDQLRADDPSKMYSSMLVKEYPKRRRKPI